MRKQSHQQCTSPLECRCPLTLAGGTTYDPQFPLGVAWCDQVTITRRACAVATHKPEVLYGSCRPLLVAMVDLDRSRSLRPGGPAARGRTCLEGLSLLGAVRGHAVLSEGSGPLAAGDLRRAGHGDGQARPSGPAPGPPRVPRWRMPMRIGPGSGMRACATPSCNGARPWRRPRDGGAVSSPHFARWIRRSLSCVLRCSTGRAFSGPKAPSSCTCHWTIMGVCRVGR